ncbi:uncharacterized protein [Dermacentor albipictus]|uniref:uncharacterized protein n=1 Tax=Dermacentor albipictus TaxID=60249 RepID=UPI0038FC7BE3
MAPAIPPVMLPNMTTTSAAPTTTSTAPSTRTQPLFKRKPFVVCHLLSPTLFGVGKTRSDVAKQLVPSPMFCDYIILDLPMLPGRIYAHESYAFLSGGTAGRRFLFHIPIQPPNAAWFQDLINTQDFVTSTANIQTALRPNKLHGFGTINGLGLLESTRDDMAMIAYLDDIYTRFSNVLRTTGTAPSEVKNFFAFKPSSSVIHDTYVQYLTILNSVYDIGLVIILTITDENIPEVYPSSAWDATCLPDLGQPNMFDAVSAILQVPNPNVNFSLALSLRFDLFNEADFSKLHATTLSRIACTSHKAFWFTTTCWHHLYRKDPTGASIHYIGGDKCAFAESSDTTGAVISLETRATIRHKFDAVSAILQVPKPNVHFTLALSLRLDVFNDVEFSALPSTTLSRIPCISHHSLWFTNTCWPQLYRKDPTGASIHYIGGDKCAFARSNGTTVAVISFETPATIRHKMVETYRTIGYDRTDTYVVGWLVYNATYGLAPAPCHGRFSRIQAIRKVIDGNK